MKNDLIAIDYLIDFTSYAIDSLTYALPYALNTSDCSVICNSPCIGDVSTLSRYKQLSDLIDAIVRTNLDNSKQGCSALTVRLQRKLSEQATNSDHIEYFMLEYTSLSFY